MKRITFNEEKKQVLKDLKKIKTKKKFIQLLSLYLRAQGCVTIQVINQFKDKDGVLEKIQGKII
jgi:hypothetical protein